MPGAAAPGPDQPLLSVVIPTLGRPTLADQLAALAACTWSQPWEVVAADNGSNDRVATICRAWTGRVPQLRWIDATDRAGRSHAVNRGAEAARGRWLLFVDDDDLVEPDLISAVGETFVAGARAVAFNFNIRQVNEPAVWQSHALACAAEHGRPMFRSIPALWGCSAIERQLFLDLGGFDEEHPYAEDLDFSVRLHRQTDVVPVHLARQLVHYRLQGDVRARFRQRVLVAEAVQSIAERHPDVARPLATDRPTRLRRLVSEGGRALPLTPRAVRREGRLVLADRLGEAWGHYVAARGDR